MHWSSSILSAAAPAFAASILVGCGDGGTTADGRTKVAVQLNWVPEPEFGGFWQAELDGEFAKVGLDVQLISGGPGIPAAQLVASGKAAFGVVSGPELLSINEQGAALVAIFATYQGDPTAIMVHESSPWRTLEELWASDATIACESSLPFVIMLNRTHGGSRLKFVGHSTGLADFVNDPLLAKQCFVFAEPVTLELQGIRTRIFPARGSGFDPYTAVVVTSRRYLESNPGTCRAMVMALRSGWTRYLEDPAAANAAMTKLNPSMSLEAMNLAAEKQRFLVEDDTTRGHAVGWMTSDRWRTLAEQMVSLEKLKAVPSTLEGSVFWQPPVAPPPGGEAG